MMIKFIVEIFVRAFDLFTTHSFITFELSKFSSSIIERVSCFVLGSKVHSFSFPHFDALHVFPIFFTTQKNFKYPHEFFFLAEYMASLNLGWASFAYRYHELWGEGEADDVCEI